MPQIYVYRRASSTGARELADALGGRRFRGRIRPIGEQVHRGDTVICWGEALDPLPGVKLLNGAAITNKYQDAIKIAAAGVATIQVSQAKPVVGPANDNGPKGTWEEVIEAAEDFIEIPFARINPVFIDGVKNFAVLITKLRDELAKPLAAPQEWLPRLNNHVGGADLLAPPAAADYWVKKESITDEVRIHSFRGKSIKAGHKVPRPGTRQHEWIRSFDSGWNISYEGFESTKVQRELAHAAVKALGLDFGAVDLAKTAGGKWIVLEVNRAPGISDGTITTYANAIKGWMAAPQA